MTSRATAREFGLGAAVLGGAFFAWVPPASAQCIGPAISLDRASGLPSAVVVVHGTGFLNGCNDTIIVGQPPTPTPIDRGIRVEFRQLGHTETLVTVDAGQDDAFVAQVRIPSTAVVGSAEIAAVGSNGSPAQPFTVLRAARGLAATGGSGWQLVGWGLLGVATSLLLRVLCRRPEGPEPWRGHR